MDYRKFLGKTTTQVLPYFGGAYVVAAERRLHVKHQIEPGWWQFNIEGRKAMPQSKADAVDLSACQSVRGHVLDDWLFISGRQIERLHFVPTGMCDVFSPCSARRWHQGSLIFTGVEFEDEAEINVRTKLEEYEPITELKGVAASLRCAYGYALLSAAARQRQMPVALREVVNRLADIAGDGMPLANQLLDEIHAQRVMQQNRLRGMSREGLTRAGTRRAARTLEDKLAEILHNAGADFRSARQLEDGLIEVTYHFMDERFISVVDDTTFNVFDAGICLDGADREVTLESLPSVIREAIDIGALYITRH